MAGLAGIGDLMLTCLGGASRNKALGGLGKGGGRWGCWGGAGGFGLGGGTLGFLGAWGEADRFPKETRPSMFENHCFCGYPFGRVGREEAKKTPLTWGASQASGGFFLFLGGWGPLVFPVVG